MKQTKLMSFIESIGGTAIGFVVAFFANMLVLPWFGLVPSVTDNLLITTVYTAISIVRGFGVRRLFEALHIRRPLSPFMQAVIAERFRQTEAEGYDATHDDGLPWGDLAAAGAVYALGNRRAQIFGASRPRDAGRKVKADIFWPWSDRCFKPTPDDDRRRFVKAAALILAEGDRNDRLRKSRRNPQIENVASAASDLTAAFPQLRHHALAHGKSPSEQGGSSA